MKFDIPDFSNHPAVKDFLLDRKPYFILDENKNAIPANAIEWGDFFENRTNRIVKQEMVNDCWVSTIFMGIDHNPCYFKEDVHHPHIFETMVFKGKERYDYCERYSTWQEAEDGHKKAIDWVKDGCKEDE